MTAEHWGELAALATALLWTLSSLAWTSAGKHVGALAVSFVRLVITCGFLLVHGRVFRGLWLPSDATEETWLILGASGFIGFFIGDLCIFKAFLLIGPRLSILLQSLAPPMAAVISWFMLGQGLPPLHWLGMAITLGGVAWVVLEQPEDPASAPPTRHTRQGVLLAMLAAATMAVGLVLSKLGLGDYDAFAATFIRVLGAMLGYLLLITALRRWAVIGRAVRQPRAMTLMTGGSIVGPYLGVAMCMVAVRSCHPGVVSTIINTMPILILPFVVVLYREKVSLRAIGGAVLSVLGVGMLAL